MKQSGFFNYLEDCYNHWIIHQEKLRMRSRRMKRRKNSRRYRAYRKRLMIRRLILGSGAVLSLLLVFFLVKGLVFTISLAGSKLSGLFGGGKKEQVVAEKPEEEESAYQAKDITIGSTGCMLLHSPFLTSYVDDAGNYDFSSIYQYIQPYYSEPDYMVCEFEGVLTGAEVGYSGYPLFHSPDAIIENIRDSGVDLQLLANNHIYDGGSDGLVRTMKTYDEKSIAFTGVRESTTDPQYYIADVDGVKIGFLNYVYETEGSGKNLNGIYVEEAYAPLINSFDYDDLDSFYTEVETNIKAMKEEGAQFLIANMHWGDEYQLTESSTQDQIAQKLCDLGIDALIGGHPHVEQPAAGFTSTDGEHKMFCIFSVGNALSNQRKELIDQMPDGHTEDGVMITLKLHQNEKGEVSITGIEALPTWVYRYQEDGSKYFIFPLDDLEHLEETTGISGIKEEAADSHDRTEEELKSGLSQAAALLGVTAEVL